MRTTGTDRNIQINGTTINYIDLGEGETPLIFVHGFPFDKSSWLPQIDFFKDKHRVIAYDIRGFGSSSIGREEFSMRLFADDLVSLMDKLEIRKAIVCGLSMGGYILMNAAHRYSERFEAIILSDILCIADSIEMKEQRGAIISQIKSEGLDNFAEGYVKNIFCLDSMDNKNELVEKIRGTILSTSSITIIETLNALAQRWQMLPSLKEISVPTLILYGKEDKTSTLVESEVISINILNSTIQCIKNAGRMSNLEQPKEFNFHFSNFISALA